jgi:hypothetical protein
MERVQIAPSLFCPITPRSLGLSDVKPKHSLVIWARDPWQTQVRIEADIDRAEKLGNTWQIGTTNFYEHGTGRTRLSIGVIDPERYALKQHSYLKSILTLTSTLDWCLEVVTNNTLKKIPQEFYGLAVNSSVGKSADRADQLGWPYPSIVLQVPPGVTVDNTWIKSIIRYRIMDTSYILEASVYRRWQGPDTKKEPSVLCGVSVYNKEWDILMSPEESVIQGRNWAIGLNELFPNAAGPNSGFSDFISKIKIVQSFLECI